MDDNDFFLRICREATNELASGKISFKDAPTNTLLLAAFGMLWNHLATRIAKPLWWFAGSVSAGVIGYLVHLVVGGG